MNPYTEIEVTPLYSKDGMKSNGKSVRIKDEEEWNEIGVVSPNYLLVHNRKVKEVVDQLARYSPYKIWKPMKQFFDGRRFVYSITTENLTVEITPGDLVRFGLIGYNSYDGSRALSVGMYADHLVCSNGMTSATYFSRFTFKHNQGNFNWNEQVEGAFRSILPNSEKKLVAFAESLRKLKSKPVDTNSLQHIRKDFLSDLSVSSWGKVVDRWLLNEEHNAFGLLDACTQIFWHNAKQNYSDYKNNTYATDSLIKYSDMFLN